MNKQDIRRRDALIRTLEKAKEQAQSFYLYLYMHAGSVDPVEIADAFSVREDIDNAIERLQRLTAE